MAAESILGAPKSSGYAEVTETADERRDEARSRRMREAGPHDGDLIIHQSASSTIINLGLFTWPLVLLRRDRAPYGAGVVVKSTTSTGDGPIKNK